MKLKVSNYHLLNMNSIRGLDFFYILYNPLWFVWIFRTLFLENTCWWLLLYVLEALVFQNTTKWMLSSLSNQANFFSKYFHLKNHPKKHVPLFSLPWWEGIPSLISIMFSCTLPLLKNFSLQTKRKDYIHKTY